MDEQALAELAQSIRSQGLLQPLVVRPVEAGLRADRRRAALARGADGRARPGTGGGPRGARRRGARHGADRNIQREDLNAMEEAAAVQRLIDEFKMTHEQPRTRGRSRSATSNLLRLLKLASRYRRC